MRGQPPEPDAALSAHPRRAFRGKISRFVLVVWFAVKINQFHPGILSKNRLSSRRWNAPWTFPLPPSAFRLKRFNKWCSRDIVGMCSARCRTRRARTPTLPKLRHYTSRLKLKGHSGQFLALPHFGLTGLVQKGSPISTLECFNKNCSCMRQTSPRRLGA
jgi:hypothetical protein